MNKNLANALILPFMIMAMKDILKENPNNINHHQENQENEFQKIPKGLKKFEKDGKTVWALNQKSADRKFKKLGI